MKSNVLYVFADQLAMKALSMYGSEYGAKTPHMDRLAENGVRFTRSYCSTPQCSPSRSSILTGLYPHKTKVLGNYGTPGTEDLSPHMETIGHYFKNKGYFTGYFGKWHLGGPEIAQFGFDSYIETAAKGDKLASDRERDIHTTLQALSFIRSHKDDPWFAMVSYTNPHDIYNVKKQQIASEYDHIGLPENFNDTLMNKPKVQAEFRDQDQGKALIDFDDEGWKQYIAYYCSLVEHVDQELGQLIHLLSELGQLEETLIIFTSDHGDMLGSHRIPFKGPMMYDELVKIPLVYSWPGVIPSGKSIDQTTVNVDHFATICDLLELDIPQNTDGYSMKKSMMMHSDEQLPNYRILQYYSKQKWVNPIRTVIQGEYKYNLYLNGEEELYDTKQDGGEMNNLALNPEFANVKNELIQNLLQWINTNQDPFFTFGDTDRSGNPIHFH